MMRKKIAALALLALLSACATLSNLNKNYSLGPKPTQSVVVIGVKPDDIRFGVEEGTLVKDQFKGSPTATPIFALYPDHGYVVAVMDTTDPDQLYALTNLKQSIHLYRGCGHALETFAVEPGKIIYLGDFEFADPPAGLKHTISYDPASAEKFMRDNYPNLKDVPFAAQKTLPRDEVGFHQSNLQWLMTTCD
jgi:hypothetical protein